MPEPESKVNTYISEEKTCSRTIAGRVIQGYFLVKVLTYQRIDCIGLKIGLKMKSEIQYIFLIVQNYLNKTVKIIDKTTAPITKFLIKFIVYAGITFNDLSITYTIVCL